MLDAAFPLDLERLQLSPHDVERRKAFVGLQPEDVERIRSIQDIFLPNADRYIAAFFDHLAGIEEATRLSGNYHTLEEAKRLEHEHLIAMMQGDYGRDYMEQRVRLGMLYSRAGLDVRILLGAFHVLLRSLGAEVMKHFAKDPTNGFNAFISVKKIGFLDIGLTADRRARACHQLAARCHSRTIDAGPSGAGSPSHIADHRRHRFPAGQAADR